MYCLYGLQNIDAHDCVDGVAVSTVTPISIAVSWDQTRHGTIIVVLTLGVFCVHVCKAPHDTKMLTGVVGSKGRKRCC